MTDKMKRLRRIEAVGEDLKSDKKQSLSSIIANLTKTAAEPAKSVKVISDVKSATKPTHA